MVNKLFNLHTALFIMLYHKGKLKFIYLAPYNFDILVSIYIKFDLLKLQAYNKTCVIKQVTL